MPIITFVTSSSDKLAEAKAILPFEIIGKTLELDEIQSLDIEKIVHHKLHQAYKITGVPVIVDDVSAELVSLNGLPGPFIKFFEQKLGPDALYKLSKKGEKANIICCLGYCDGKQEIIVKGILKSSVTAPRGKNGWGFDKVIVPDGQSHTMAEMTDDEKNKLSHRYLALQELSKRLKMG